MDTGPEAKKSIFGREVPEELREHVFTRTGRMARTQGSSDTRGAEAEMNKFEVREKAELN